MTTATHLRPSSSFRLWSARIGGGRITRYQCVQWAHAVAGPGDYGYQAHGKRTNLTRQEAAALCDQLAEIVERTGDGLALTDDHQEAGRAWMRKYGADVGLPVVGSDGATVEVVRFAFVGAYDYDEGENDWRGIMAPRYRTHLADGRTFDYAPTPWQASAYGQRKLPLWWEMVQS